MRMDGPQTDKRLPCPRHTGDEHEVTGLRFRGVMDDLGDRLDCRVCGSTSALDRA
jgi:hypothetical protein